MIGDRALDDAHLNLARHYCSQLQNQNLDAEGATSVRAFLRSAKRAKRLLDEANDITDAVRPQDNLCFELTSIAPVMSFGFAPLDLPVLGVRLVKKVSAASKRWKHALQAVKHSRISWSSIITQLDNIATVVSEENVQEIATWSFTRFRGRLELMRDTYVSWTADPTTFKIDPLFDPWKDVGPAEARDLCHGKDDQLSVMQTVLDRAGTELEGLRKQVAESASWKQRAEAAESREAEYPRKAATQIDGVRNEADEVRFWKQRAEAAESREAELKKKLAGLEVSHKQQVQQLEKATFDQRKKDGKVENFRKKIGMMRQNAERMERQALQVAQELSVHEGAFRQCVDIVRSNQAAVDVLLKDGEMHNGVV